MTVHIRPSPGGVPTDPPCGTVPAAVAALVLAGRPDDLRALEATGRQVGVRTELDLADVARLLGGKIAAALAGYWRECGRMWVDPDTLPTHQVNYRRVLASYRQTTGTRGRADLGDVYYALNDIPFLRPWVDAATDPVPDPERLSMEAETFNGHVSFPEDGLVATAVQITAGMAFPQGLGGVPNLGETHRRIELECRQAKWRDRRIRRLAKVTVRSIERWPNPAPWTPAG